MRSNVALAAGGILGATAGLVCLLLLTWTDPSARPSGAAGTPTPKAGAGTIPDPKRVADPAKAGPGLGTAGGTRPATGANGKVPRPDLPPGFAASGKKSIAPGFTPPPPAGAKKAPPITDRVQHGISGFHEGVDLGHPVPLAAGKGATITLPTAPADRQELKPVR